MSNLRRIKTSFVSSILRETAEKIQTEQQQVIQEWNLFGSDEKRLYNSLKGHFSLEANEGGAKLKMGYLKYARFLDMSDERRKRKREGFHLYNRILFGNIYSNALPRIMFDLTDEVKAKIATELKQIEEAKYPVGKENTAILNLVSTNVGRNLAAVIAKSARMGY